MTLNTDNQKILKIQKNIESHKNKIISFLSNMNAFKLKINYIWKIIINLNNGDVNAWIMPNDETAGVKNIDPYLVTISEIEQKSGFQFPGITNDQRFKKAKASWVVPKGCDLS